MARTKISGLKKSGGARKRRRSTSVSTRAKWQKPTARNQRSQILGNARMISKIRRLLPPVVYCDWQYKQEILGEISPDGLPTLAIQSYVLTDFSKWQDVLRISPTVADAVATHIVRFNIDMRYSLVNSDWAQMSVFIVTMRKDHANRDPTVSALQSGSDFILADNQFNPTLNSAVFKVHFCRHITMTKNAWLTPPVQQGSQPAFSGDPMTTFRKGNINMKPNIRVRAPAIESWKALPYAQLPYYQRYFLLTFINSNNAAAPAVGTQARIDMNFMATTRNSA